MADGLETLKELRRKMLKPRWLAVDDDPVFLELMSTAFSAESEDIELHCVESGERALQVLAGGFKPDEVILDLRMTGMDGIETFREIKKRYPDVKVSILTGAPEDDRLKEIPAIGWAKIFPKPNSLEGFGELKGALLNV